MTPTNPTTPCTCGHPKHSHAHNGTGECQDTLTSHNCGVAICEHDLSCYCPHYTPTTQTSERDGKQLAKDVRTGRKTETRESLWL